MPGIRWGKFSGRSRGAGHGGKGRKCEKLDSKEAAKCKESECMRKKGFWNSRCIKNPVADVSVDIKTSCSTHGKSLLEVEKRVDAKFSFVSACNSLQEAELKKRVECIEDVRQSVCSNAYVDDGNLQVDCMEASKLSTGGESGCMAYVWLDAISGEEEERVAETCSMPCRKVNCTDEKGECEDSQKAAADDNAGNEDSLQDVNCKVIFKSSSDSHEMKEEDRTPDTQKIEHLLMKNRGMGLRMVPHDFICGISKRVMEDPVVIASGQTFERGCIQAWLDEGNTHCPITHKPLSHFQLIPNLTLKTLISSWLSSASHDFGLETAQTSFSSCVSSFSSCPSLMTGSDEKFVSCSSFSISKLLEDMELHSLSSSSIASLPKLLIDAQLQSFSSSSISAHSSSSPERHTQNLSLTPSSTRSSSCWEQELCPSPEIELSDSIPSDTSTQGGSPSQLLKRSQKCVLHNKLNDVIPLSRKASTYTRSRINSLVSDLQSDYLDIQRSAAAELRLLAKHDDSNRVLIASAGALKPLISLLQSADERIQQEVTTALLNLSLSHALKEGMVKEGSVEALVRVLRDGLSEVVKENAAVALAHLAACEANRSQIGMASAVPPLMDLLERGSPRGKKDAAAALYRLSSDDENKRRMVRAGALRPLVGFMSNEGKEGMVDKAMAILRNLVGIEEGRAAFVEEGGIISLLQVIEAGSQRSRGLAVPMLFQLCTHSSKYRSLVLQNEPLPTLMSISKTADVRLKTQVTEMIEVLIVDA